MTALDLGERRTGGVPSKSAMNSIPTPPHTPSPGAFPFQVASPTSRTSGDSAYAPNQGQFLAHKALQSLETSTPAWHCLGMYPCPS